MNERVVRAFESLLLSTPEPFKELMGVRNSVVFCLRAIAEESQFTAELAKAIMNVFGEM